MTCKRCGCTNEKPCPGGCAWSLPDVCTRCTTEDERRLEAQYESLFQNLREELKADRFERFLLAIAQGMSANPGINIESCRGEAFTVRAIELAQGLCDATDPDVDDGEDESSPIVEP